MQFVNLTTSKFNIQFNKKPIIPPADNSVESFYFIFFLSLPTLMAHWPVSVSIRRQYRVGFPTFGNYFLFNEIINECLNVPNLNA